MSYLTEDQQVELLKKLWKEYGLSILTGVILAVMIVFGWRFYQSYRIERSEQASTVYEHMMIGLMNEQYDEAEGQANLLQKQFRDTPYATFAALTLAKLAVNKNQLDSAKASLQWVIDHGNNKAFREVARIRLAKVNLQENHPLQALQLLDHSISGSFLPIAKEVEGDAYKQMNKIDEARAAYQLALSQLPEAALNRPLLQMKLADLPADIKNQHSSIK